MTATATTTACGVPIRTVMPQEYLRAKTSPKSSRPYVVYDVESKGDTCSCRDACGKLSCDGSCARCAKAIACRGTCPDSQDAGFTRPFMVGFLAPSKLWNDDAGDGLFKFFKNDPCVKELPWDRRHDAPGGCIDQLLRFLFEELPDLLNKEGRGGFRGLTIYAHNGGNFDHQFLLRWLDEHWEQYEWECVPVQSSIQQIQVKARGDKKPMWFFNDSAKIIPLSLDRACESFGVKGKLKHNLNLPEDHVDWQSYLRQDCVALNEVVGRFVEVVEDDLGGEVGLTAAATSMNLFRRRFLKNKIPRHAHFPDCPGYKEDPLAVNGLQPLDEPEPCTGCLHDFVRAAYFGGRTEIFKMTGQNLRYFDINSSYVHALCEPMPAGEKMIEYGQISWKMAESYVGFAKCTVWIPESCEIPPLPFVSPETGKLKFEKGLLEGTWDVAELALLEHPRVQGTIVKVERVVWIRGKVVAKDMMMELWKLRDKSLPTFDKGVSECAKLLGNSLYGKFGQRRERTSIVRARDVPAHGGECFLCGGVAPERREICKGCEGSKPCGPGGHETSLDGGYWYKHKDVDPAYVIPQIAAHVTSLARIRLFHFMMTALDLGGRVYMVDTDSVITDADMPCSNKLGDLKDEYPDKTLNFHAVQPKVYCLEFTDGAVFDKAHLPKPFCPGTDDEPCSGCATSKVTMKGFKKEQRTKENLLKLEDGLARIRAGEKLRKDDKVTFKNPQKVRSLASAGFRGSPRMVTIEKGFQSPYDKREVHPDGTTTAHFRLPSKEKLAELGIVVDDQAAE